MSYARDIEQRTIHSTYITLGYTNNALRFESIIKDGIRIGAKAFFRQSADRWLLKCFVDGTALYKPRELYAFNQPTRTSISNIIEKYYKRIKVIDGNSVINGARIELLQYKLLPYASTYLFKSESFTQYLESKYNYKGETL